MRGGAAKVSLGELRAPPPNSALLTGEPVQRSRHTSIVARRWTLVFAFEVAAA